MKTMNHVGRSILAAGLLVLGLGVMKEAQAANPDTMTVSVTPSVTYSVAITSVNSSGYQFGTVALGATTVSTSAIVLTNNGNVSEYFSMAMGNTSGSWVPVTGSPGTDQFRMIPYLNATQVSSSTFVTGDAITTTQPGTAASSYNQASTKTNVNATKNLWLRLDMPTALNAGGTGLQTMTLSVYGQGS